MSLGPFRPSSRGERGGADALAPGGEPAAWKKFVEFGLIALLVFSPLPQGSAWEWSILVIQLSVLALALVYVLFNRDAPSAALSRTLRLPRVLI